MSWHLQFFAATKTAALAEVDRYFATMPGNPGHTIVRAAIDSFPDGQAISCETSGHVDHEAFEYPNSNFKIEVRQIKLAREPAAEHIGFNVDA